LQHGSQSSPNPKTQDKAATIASYRFSHVLANHEKPFQVSDIVKEAFLEAADSFFEDFNNKTQIVKCNSPKILLQGNVWE